MEAFYRRAQDGYVHTDFAASVRLGAHALQFAERSLKTENDDDGNGNGISWRSQSYDQAD